MNSNKRGVRRRDRRTLSKLSTLSVAAIAAGAVAAPAANSEVISVGQGRNVGIFHNIDFVAGFGWAVGQELTVEVFRGTELIGKASGPTIALDEGLPLAGALEVNHGPEGAPQRGDCWTGYTPDIKPLDEVRLTQNGVTDSVIIDPITVEVGPFLNAANKVQVEGRASLPDGTPIEIATLDSGGVLNTSKFRGGPNEQFRTPGTADGWTMVFDPASPMSAPGRDGREPAGLTPATRQDLLMSGEYSMGYGHVAPLPPETQLFEGNAEAPGPALGCEGENGKNSIIGTDDEAVNANSGDLVVNGGRSAPTVDVNVTVTDSDGTAIGPFAATPAAGAWDVTVPRAQLLTLAEGALSVSASYTGGGGNGNTLDIEKDTVAPVVPAGPPPAAAAGPVAQAVRVLAPALAPAAPRVTLNVSRSSYRLARSVRLRSARRNGVRVRYTAPAGANRMQFAVYRSSGASARRALVKRTVRVRPGQRSIRLKWRGMRAGRYVLHVRALRNSQGGRVSRRSFKITR